MSEMCPGGGETERIRPTSGRRAVGGLSRRTQRFGSAIRDRALARKGWRANSRSRAEPDERILRRSGVDGGSADRRRFRAHRDLAQMERGGSFEYLTRMGDVLRLGGFLVSPAEIEAEVQAHPAVVGVQVSALGGADRAIALWSLRLAWRSTKARSKRTARGGYKYKVPAKVVSLEAFPVTESANGIDPTHEVARNGIGARF